MRILPRLDQTGGAEGGVERAVGHQADDGEALTCVGLHTADDDLSVELNGDRVCACGLTAVGEDDDASVAERRIQRARGARAGRARVARVTGVKLGTGVGCGRVSTTVGRRTRLRAAVRAGGAVALGQAAVVRPAGEGEAAHGERERREEREPPPA